MIHPKSLPPEELSRLQREAGLHVVVPHVQTSGRSPRVTKQRVVGGKKAMNEEMRTEFRKVASEAIDDVVGSRLTPTFGSVFKQSCASALGYALVLGPVLGGLGAAITVLATRRIARPHI